MSDKFPFTQKIISDHSIVRKFSRNVDANQLVWHRDREDRIVEVISGKGWSIQLDNQLPQKLTEGSTITIKSGEYHRVLKGKDDLVLRIFEGKDQNDDGDSDFEDVKIARMKASGMSDAEIKKKHPELFENKKSNHDPNYKAPEGSKRDKQLDATQADLASGDPEREARAWRRRERMEKQASKNESLYNLVEEILSEELSKATEDKIRKVAEKRGMTFGSTKAEYKKGLAAWGTSGSRPGVSQHAWAMARINKANPSDDWSVIKKSKAKKK